MEECLRFIFSHSQEFSPKLNSLGATSKENPCIVSDKEVVFLSFCLNEKSKDVLQKFESSEKN